MQSPESTASLLLMYYLFIYLSYCMQPKEVMAEKEKTKQRKYTSIIFPLFPGPSLWCFSRQCCCHLCPSAQRYSFFCSSSSYPVHPSPSFSLSSSNVPCPTLCPYHLLSSQSSKFLSSLSHLLKPMPVSFWNSMVPSISRLEKRAVFISVGWYLSLRLCGWKVLHLRMRCSGVCIAFEQWQCGESMCGALIRCIYDL